MDVSTLANPPIVISPQALPVKTRKSRDSKSSHKRGNGSESRGTVYVVRDDLLPGGTKQRALVPLILSHPLVSEFAYASPVFGYAQVALAWCCKVTGRKARVFLPKHRPVFPLTRMAVMLGAEAVEVDCFGNTHVLTASDLDPDPTADQEHDDILTSDDESESDLNRSVNLITQPSSSLDSSSPSPPSPSPSPSSSPKKAALCCTKPNPHLTQRLKPTLMSTVRRAAHKHLFSSRSAHGPLRTHLVPFGLSSEEFTSLLQRAVSSAWPQECPPPRRVWLVAGSGVILRALAGMWRDAQFCVVRIGKRLYEDVLEGIDVRVFVAPEKFWEDARQPPPYPSVSNYDAKLWRFVEEHGEDGDLVWNVGKDLTPSDIAVYEKNATSVEDDSDGNTRQWRKKKKKTNTTDLSLSSSLSSSSPSSSSPDARDFCSRRREAESIYLAGSDANDDVFLAGAIVNRLAEVSSATLLLMGRISALDTIVFGSSDDTPRTCTADPTYSDAGTENALDTIEALWTLCAKRVPTVLHKAFSHHIALPANLAASFCGISAAARELNDEENMRLALNHYVHSVDSELGVVTSPNADTTLAATGKDGADCVISASRRHGMVVRRALTIAMQWLRDTYKDPSSTSLATHSLSGDERRRIAECIANSNNRGESKRRKEASTNAQGGGSSGSKEITNDLVSALMSAALASGSGGVVAAENTKIPGSAVDIDPRGVISDISMRMCILSEISGHVSLMTQAPPGETRHVTSLSSVKESLWWTGILEKFNHDIANEELQYLVSQRVFY